MKIDFKKFHGAGNDFVIMDSNSVPENWITPELVNKICDRKFGVGADGLIIIKNIDGFDFEMIYFNSDGNPSSMCGNGGRCAAVFAKVAGLCSDVARFKTSDGIHTANVLSEEHVILSMQNPEGIEQIGSDFFLNTGSPHLVKFISNIQQVDVMTEGKQIRNSNPYKKEGVNVNFVSTEHGISMRTYERGVEAETLSCGTGTVAVALAVAKKMNYTSGKFETRITAPGGILTVHFKLDDQQKFSEIFLEGPVKHVFDGTIETKDFE